jgi:hypothetical protein
MKQIIFAAVVLMGLSIFCTKLNAQTTKYILTNSSGQTVTAVYVEPAGTTTWTSNVYTVKDPLLNNATYEFTRTVDPSNCVYDIKYSDVNGNEYYSRNVNLRTTTAISLPLIKVK